MERERRFRGNLLSQRGLRAERDRGADEHVAWIDPAVENEHRCETERRPHLCRRRADWRPLLSDALERRDYLLLSNEAFPLGRVGGRRNLLLPRLRGRVGWGAISLRWFLHPIRNGLLPAFEDYPRAAGNNQRVMWGGIPRSIVSASLVLLLATLGAQQLPGTAPITARAAATFDNNAAEQQLFDLINQDRGQNGLGPLVANPTLFNIARSAPHQVCGNGQTYNGRAQDMIERQYFSHQIPPCGQYVWPVLTSYGVQWTSVGENIAWNTYSPQSTSVTSANTAFMNSAGHRANILGAYNQVGVGAFAAPGPWSDGSGGGPWNGVQMYVEIFANGPLPALTAPTNAVATPGDGAATLSWTAPAQSGLGVSSYTVTPYVNGTTAGTPIVYSAGSTTVLVTGLANGTGYTFTVTATNAAGSSPPSAASNLVVPSGTYPHLGLSTAQYQSAGSGGATCTEICSTKLTCTFTTW